MKKIRMDMIDSGNQDEVRLSDEENIPEGLPKQPEKDAFDDLLAHYSKPSSLHNLTMEQQERMAENKRKAEERRKSRLQSLDNSSVSTNSFADSQHEKGASCSPAKEHESEDLMDIDSMLADISQE